MYNGEEIVQITILALPNELLDQAIIYEELREAVSSVFEDCSNQIHIKDLMNWTDEEYEEWISTKEE